MKGKGVCIPVKGSADAISSISLIRRQLEGSGCCKCRLCQLFEIT